MKKIFFLFTIFIALGITSCEGPPGLPGIDAEITSIYEITKVDFVLNNNFGIKYTFPKPNYTSDIILVYRLSGIDNGKDVWKLLPETYYFNNGTRNFGYNFDFTSRDIDIYLEGNDLQTVETKYRLNQIFRIAVVPANVINSIDRNNYNAVMSTLKIKENQIEKIDL
jgi:hypothetical protein